MVTDGALNQGLTDLLDKVRARRDSARNASDRAKAIGDTMVGAALAGKSVAYNDVLVQLSQLLGVPNAPVVRPSRAGGIQEHKSSRGGVNVHRKNAVFLRHGYTCHYCHTRPATEIEHVVPKVLGGTNALFNLVPSCEQCNDDKGSRLWATHCDHCQRAVFAWTHRMITSALRSWPVHV